MPHQKIRILIHLTDTHLCEELTRLLGKENFQVLSSKSDGAPDLVVSTCTLILSPVQSTPIYLITSHPCTGSTPTSIAVSGSVGPEELAEVLTQHASGFSKQAQRPPANWRNKDGGWGDLID